MWGWYVIIIPIFKHMKKKFRLLFFCLLYIQVIVAQDVQTTYQLPPKDIVDMATAPPLPTVLFTENGETMLLLQRNAFMEIADLAQPELRIAGIRINPKSFAQSRVPFIISITKKEAKTGKETIIQGLPANPKISFVRYSPSETKFAFIHQGSNGNELWVGDLANATAKKWSDIAINSTLGNPYQWYDDKNIIATTVRTNALPPVISEIPTGPNVQETDGTAAPAATFQDLLKTASDGVQFEYYCTADLCRINETSITSLVKDRIISSFDLSPDLNHILIQSVKKPFSFLVPYTRFASEIEVLNVATNEVKSFMSLPSDEVRPKGFDATTKNPRGFHWRDDEAATIAWIQALDEGDPKKKVEFRDAVKTLKAPFTADPGVVYNSTLRLRELFWSTDQLAIAEEGLFSTRQTLIKKFNPSTAKSDTLFAFSADDEYHHPGNLVMKQNKYKRPAVLTNGKEIYTVSPGASPDGNMPFLATYSLADAKQKIVWRCQAPYYEMPVKIIDMEKGSFITSRESVHESPNYYMKNFKLNQSVAITKFPDPQPQMAGVKKEKIQYTREDGINLTAVLYTPKGYDKAKDGPLPVMMWAYPREYKSAADAAQVRGSKYTYTRVGSGSPLFWVLRGYAVMDQTEMPIVGAGDDEPNDTYVKQLVQNAEAAVNKVVSLGVGDRARIGVGGHSYGAFMTANLLAHSDLFKAGIARSGAYNRTLTPFGFQREQRTYWEAPEVYNAMSPFMNANKINEPILLIHGEADNNSGTFPIQSERLYSAIKGNGGTARLVMLPFESHGYAAKESVLHTLFEMDNWLENNVKYPGRNSKKPKS